MRLMNMTGYSESSRFIFVSQKTNCNVGLYRLRLGTGIICTQNMVNMLQYDHKFILL